MISYQKDDIKFNFRVAAILYNPDQTKVLLLQTPGSSFYALPGGRVEEMESSEVSICRELTEEMGVTANVQLAKVFENFFVMNDKKYHEIAFYYLVTQIDKSELYALNEFDGAEPKDHFKWINISELPAIDLRPEAIKHSIQSREMQLEHKIVDEI